VLILQLLEHNTTQITSDQFVQETQVLHRDCAILHVIEYFAKSLRSLKVIENGTTRKLGYGFLLSNYDHFLYTVSEIKRDIGRTS